MPASRRASEPVHGAAPAHDEAVSEVLGQILMFGILSMVLVLSLMTFNLAKEEAQERVVDTTAGSLAQRISSLVIDTAIFAESFEESDVSLESTVALPEFVENHSYTVQVDGSQVTVTVPGTGAVATSSLFAAGSGDIHVCGQDAIQGGPVTIHIVHDDDVDADPADGVIDFDCDAAPGVASYYIYLEPAT